MITMKKVTVHESVDVDFDEYVPLTITWSSAKSLLEPPKYVELRTKDGYLEFKFNPFSEVLIEVVLATVIDIKIEQGNLAPHSSEDVNLMPFLESGDAFPGAVRQLVVKAYSDYLYISFGPDPDKWTGPGPVLFGIIGEQGLAAICARWTDSERESVLADH